MKPDAKSPDLQNQAEQALVRYEALRLRHEGAEGAEGAHDRLLAETLHELGVSLDELRAPSESSRQYCDELATARSALEAERASFHMLFEFAPDGYLVTDSAGLVLRANQMSGELFGVPRRNLVGRPLAIFVELSKRTAFRKLLHQLSIGHGRMFVFEANLVARGGHSFDASIHIATGAGELRWTIRDVTEQRRARLALYEAHQGLAGRTRELEQEVEDRRRAEDGLRRSEERARMFSTYLHQRIEEERTRIAREVHDELGAALTAIRFELSALRSSPPTEETIGSAIRRVDAAIQATRRICTDLRPSLLDHMGLWAAIEWFVEDMGGRSRIQCKLDLAPNGELEEPLRTSVFRIVQEAVTNAVRHASASSLRVSARNLDGELQIEVADDGAGIREADLVRPDSFGISGMQERARACGGQLVIEPATRGTRVRLRVPVPLVAEVLCAS